MKANHMNDTLPEHYNLVVAEINEHLDNVIRSVLRNDIVSMHNITLLNTGQHTIMYYYKGVGILIERRVNVTLAHVLTFLRTRRKKH